MSSFIYSLLFKIKHPCWIRQVHDEGDTSVTEWSTHIRLAMRWFESHCDSQLNMFLSYPENRSM